MSAALQKYVFVLKWASSNKKYEKRRPIAGLNGHIIRSDTGRMGEVPPSF
jgi:hypothetical protein